MLLHARAPPPAEAFIVKCAPCGYRGFACVCVCGLRECVFGATALQWLVSQRRGVSLPLDCCLTSRQTEHIGSGWTETPRWEKQARRREVGVNAGREKLAEREIKDGSAAMLFQ